MAAPPPQDVTPPLLGGAMIHRFPDASLLFLAIPLGSLWEEEDVSCGFGNRSPHCHGLEYWFFILSSYLFCICILGHY